MREIKFRAWDGEVLMQPYVQITPNALVIAEQALQTPMTFSQYTGLVDVNGAEIYEGDLVKPPGNNQVKVVEWRNATIGSGWNIGTGFRSTKANLEVIGNIYENLELVK